MNKNKQACLGDDIYECVQFGRDSNKESGFRDFISGFIRRLETVLV